METWFCVLNRLKSNFVVAIFGRDYGLYVWGMEEMEERLRNCIDGWENNEKLLKEKKKGTNEKKKFMKAISYL